MCNYNILIFLYFVFIIGNTELEKWSASSLRRAGLCEDHFPQDSFTNSAIKGLKRDAVPIPFECHNINVSNKDISIPIKSPNTNKHK